jgi:hypothetical protein
MAIVSLNVEKGREIVKKRFRPERNRRLTALDVEFQRALESGDTDAQAAVVAKKEALRNSTADSSIAELNDLASMIYYVPPSFED